MSKDTQALQLDNATGPAVFALLDGEALWKENCAGCHASMKGVAARYPRFVPARKKVLNLEQRINVCRTDQQKAAPFAYESKELLALAAYIGRQSRGLPIIIPVDDNTRPVLAEGRKLFFRRQGQLNLSCAQCHDDNWGKRLVGNLIPQAHPTGYPIYRLEWQGMGSLERRLRNCFIGVRAEPYAYGSPELVSLELYLMWRARGMPLETPAVRP